MALTESEHRTFHGSCHCGRVRFEVLANPTSLSQCNCSLCSKKGALYVKVREIAELRITAGESELGAYQFNTRRAKHYFCRHCGIHVFHRPRLDPERWSVNGRCLEELDVSRHALTPFDGRNWEAQATPRNSRATAPRLRIFPSNRPVCHSLRGSDRGVCHALRRSIDDRGRWLNARTRPQSRR